MKIDDGYIFLFFSIIYHVIIKLKLGDTYDRNRKGFLAI